VLHVDNTRSKNSPLDHNEQVIWICFCSHLFCCIFYSTTYQTCWYSTKFEATHSRTIWPS